MSHTPTLTESNMNKKNGAMFILIACFKRQTIICMTAKHEVSLCFDFILLSAWTRFPMNIPDYFPFWTVYFFLSQFPFHFFVHFIVLYISKKFSWTVFFGACEMQIRLHHFLISNVNSKKCDEIVSKLVIPVDFYNRQTLIHGTSHG